MAAANHAALSTLSLFSIRLDNLAHDCVADLHRILLAVSN